MRVLVTGADGYCGWPIVLRLLKYDHVVVGVDNGGRRKWVDEVNGRSFIPIETIKNRELTAKKFGNYSYYNIDLVNYEIFDLIRSFEPNVILHLASQPSAPYSSIDVKHCNFTQHNNTQMLRNIMWGIDNYKVNTHLVVTTTTGIYGAPNFKIPEGNLRTFGDELPFPSMGGSWYHMSRAHDSSNLWLASKQFNFPITELRTSIVCGSSTIDTRLSTNTRFDTDYYFGVATHRFINQTLQGKPLTVYGKGKQGKPLISLEDMVESTVNCCSLEKENKYEIFNQMEDVFPVTDIAEMVKSGCKKTLDFDPRITYVDNPRIENEEHNMVMENKRFILKLCNNRIKEPLRESIKNTFKHLIKFMNGEMS